MGKVSNMLSDEAFLENLLTTADEEEETNPKT